MRRTCARSTWRTRTSCGRSSGAQAASSSSSTSRRASSSTTATSSRRCWCGSCDRFPGSRAHGFAVTRLRVRPHRDAVLARLEPHRVHGLSDARPADLERPAHVRRGPASVPPRTGPAHRPHVGRAARGRSRGHRGAIPRADDRLLAPLGEGHARSARLPGWSSARRSRSSSISTRTPARSSRRRRRASPSIRDRAATGTTASAGSATRTSHERARAARALGGDGALPRVPEHLRGARACSSPRTASTATRTRRRGSSSTSRGTRATGRCGSAARPSSTCRTTSTARWCSRSAGCSSTRVSRARSAADGGRAHASARRPDRRAVGRAGRRAVGVPREDRLHSFSVLMHWAGARRAVEVAEALGAAELAADARGVEAARGGLLETRCWSEDVQALTQVAGEPQLDAALLLAVHLGYLAHDDPRAASHVDAIREGLSVDGSLLRRYTARDDFGHMEAAFTVCTFWLVEALALIGRTDEAREPRPAAFARQRPRALLESSRTRWSRAATSRRRTATSGSSTPRSGSPDGGTRNPFHNERPCRAIIMKEV